jgi:hypothetical protein
MYIALTTRQKLSKDGNKWQYLDRRILVRADAGNCKRATQGNEALEKEIEDVSFRGGYI